MADQNLTLSIIVPAYNEEQNLGISLTEFITAANDVFSTYEILVINDGSVDRTQAIAEDFSRRFPQIRVINHPVNQGIGAAYRTGLDAAKMNYCMFLCADNTIGAESLKEIFRKMGQADLVLPYIGNPESRSWSRRFISSIYVTFLNLIFGFHLKYYNGLHILPVHALRNMDITPSFAFSAQIVVRLLKAGYTYVDAPMLNRERTHGRTKAFKVKNILSVIKTIALLIGEIYFKPKSDSTETLKNKSIL
jgi:glycosyltransferase involved in cell wall biosynthesis